MHNIAVSPHSLVRICAHNQRPKRNIFSIYLSAVSEVFLAEIKHMYLVCFVLALQFDSSYFTVFH